MYKKQDKVTSQKLKKKKLKCKVEPLQANKSSKHYSFKISEIQLKLIRAVIYNVM